MSSPRSTRARRRKRKTRKEKVRAAERRLYRQSEEAIRRMERLAREEAGPVDRFAGFRPGANLGPIRLLPNPPQVAFPHFDYPSLERRVLVQIQGAVFPKRTP